MAINAAAKRLGNELSPALTKEHEAAHDAFNADLADLVKRGEASGKSLSSIQWASEFFGYVRKGVEAAHDRGYRAAGKASDMDASRGHAALIVSQQAEFIYRFGEDVRLNKGTMDKVRRAEMYGVQLDCAFMAGVMRAMPKGTVVHWELGPTEHCEDCEHIAGDGPYTRESLPTLPGAGETDCLCNCACYLKIDYHESLNTSDDDERLLWLETTTTANIATMDVSADYVFPDKKTWPIKTLKQAKTALVYATWPQNAKVKAQVVKAVLAKWPQLKGVGAAK